MGGLHGLNDEGESVNIHVVACKRKKDEWDYYLEVNEEDGKFMRNSILSNSKDK